MAGLAVAFLAGCTEDLPPYGEAIVYVDTDLAVPQQVSRLRVDTFTGDGVWFDSREILLSDPADWPASFGVVVPTEVDTTDVMVRIRAFPEGRSRQYFGERFREPFAYEEPTSPTTPSALCDQRPTLPLGEGRWVRRGSQVFDPGGGCLPDDQDPTAGAAGLTIDVPNASSYWLLVDRFYPPPSLAPTHVSLALRRDCDDPSTQVACVPGVSLDGVPTTTVATFPAVELTPGRYTVVVNGGFGAGAADIFVAWVDPLNPVGFFPDPDNDPILPEFPPLAAGMPLIPSEPTPETAIDQLVHLRVRYGEVTTTRVVLRGACMGTMADVRGGVASARTCLTEDAVLESVPLALAGEDDAAAPSLQGTFGLGDECPSDGHEAAAVCVPAGASLLGFPEGAGRAELATTPERLARTERFWIDRHEVTVARFRQALADGLVADMPSSRAEAGACTWTDAPGAFEQHPLNCVPWATARALCQSFGGELPTEAEWEMVAQTAGRPEPTVFPWGSTLPSCGCEEGDPTCFLAAVATSEGTCNAIAGAPTFPVDAFEGPNGDVSLGLGVVGLGGNVGEWVLDAFYPYDHRCWRGSRIDARRCAEHDPPLRAVRGGSYRSDLGEATGRFARLPNASDPDVGFRCVYPEAP